MRDNAEQAVDAGRVMTVLLAAVAAAVIGLIVVAVAVYAIVGGAGEVVDRYCDARNDCSDVGV